MAVITVKGIPKGLILAEKSLIEEVGQLAIVAAQLKFPPWLGLNNTQTSQV